jgi:hypothetical protein
MTHRTFKEMKDFAMSIDLGPLLEQIAEALGQKGLAFTTEMITDEKKEEVRIFISTDDIKDKCGIFGNSCKSIIIHTWHGNVGQIKETGELRIYWNFKFH